MITFTVTMTQNKLYEVRIHTRGPTWGRKIVLNRFFLSKPELKKLRHALSKYDN